MGNNLHGRLGLNDSSMYNAEPRLVESLMNKKVIAVACGVTHTIAITDKGYAYSWGLGELGALGTGTTTTQTKPTLIDYFSNRKIQITAASCGAKHSMFLARNAEVFACGTSDSGQLGIGTRSIEMLPKKVISCASSIACGNYWTFVVTSKGEVWGTGGNDNGQLGLGHKKSVIAFTKLEHLGKVHVKRVAAGHHTAALSSDGDLYFWGTGVFGEELIPRRVSAITSKVCDFAVGGTMGAALDALGKVWVWGSNNLGELGVNDYDPRATPFQLTKLKHIASLSCGKSFILARCHKKNTMVSDSYVSRGDKLSESNLSSLPEGTISNVDSNFSQRDPNQNLVLVLTRQRDYLEEVLDKERNEKKSVENKNTELRAEITTLKTYIERIEKEKIDSMNNTNELIDKLNTTNHKLEETYTKLTQTETTNNQLLKSIEETNAQLNESNKNYEQLKKKYTKAKKTINAHMEAQEKLVKENEVLIQKLKTQQEEYSDELNRFKEISPEQDVKIEELQNQLVELDTIKQHQAKLIEEGEAKIAALTNVATELQERVQINEGEKEELQAELTKQKSLCNKYQEDLRELDKEFKQVKKGVKKTIITEKTKTEDMQQQHKEIIYNLQTENDKLMKRIEHLENEVKNSNDQVLQLNTIKQDLESRNQKLIYSLSHCTRTHERTLSQQTENLNSTLLNDRSPPKNLIVAVSSKPLPEFGSCLTNSTLLSNW